MMVGEIESFQQRVAEAEVRELSGGPVEGDGRATEREKLNPVVRVVLTLELDFLMLKSQNENVF